MPVRGAGRSAVVLAQDVAAPVAVEVSPDRVDVVATGVVELDEEARTLDSIVVRRAAHDRPGPRKSNRVQTLRTHTGEALGIVGQTIAGLGSMVGVVLVWTGIALALRRLWAWNRRRNSPARATVQEEKTLTTA